MKVTYDTAADALYVSLARGDVAKTLKIHDRLHVDLDAEGNTLGIEILDASSQKALVEGIKKNAANGIPVTIDTSTPVTA